MPFSPARASGRTGYIERPVRLRSHDGKTIYATLTLPSGPEPSRRLIIYAHGLPSSPDDFTYLNSSRLFARRGFATLRFGFYDWRENARCLTDCDIHTHVRDLETVIARYRRSYKDIFLLGHSWGGLVIMHSSCPGVRAVSLWDPTYSPPDLGWKKWVRRSGKHLLMNGAFKCLVAPGMYQQALALDRAACCALSRSFPRPLQVLWAGKDGILLALGESFHTHATGPAECHTLADADHGFLAESAQRAAVSHSVRWFRKFSAAAS